MSKAPEYSTIEGWASHGKDQKLVKFTYTPAALLDNDVEIKISHCGICGSDIHTLDSGWSPTNYPVIVGHEIVGTVTAKGSKVNHLEVGDRVGVGAQCSACLDDSCGPCSKGNDAHCPKHAGTYNSVRSQDGAKTYGGYAEAVRVQSDYAFKLPDSIPSEFAGPLMCAGTTVFAPMLRYGMKKGDRVGVVGIGGLGHLALKFAHALGCEVTAFSHSANKKDDALAMGASKFVNISDPGQLKEVKNSLDYLIVSSSADDNDFMTYNLWMDVLGRIILVAAPETKLQIPPTALLRNSVSICGSIIGSINEIKAMLAFAGEHKVYPTIEKFPMDKSNEGIQHVRDGKVRYRVVLEN